MDWTDEYREIVEFYYWEPQHIGRAGGQKKFKNADEMYEHINRIEVSLNHVLNIFFSMYHLHQVSCFNIEDTHERLSSWRLETIEREQRKLTQPDMFFEGKDRNVAIELNTVSKCSLQQVQKYVNFHKALDRSGDKDFELIILSPHKELKLVFAEKYESLPDLWSDLGEKVAIKLVSYDELYKSLSMPADDSAEYKLAEGLRRYLQKRPDLGFSISD